MKLSIRVFWPLCAVLALAACEDPNAKVDRRATFIPEEPAALAPTCDDLIQNADETDVDCGGATCAPCGLGLVCAHDADCLSGTCVGSTCVIPVSCTNGTRDGSESDIDCGGGLCPACPPAATCNGPSDCTSGVCTLGQCAAPSCTDGVKNGTETDVDCGGASCGACAADQRCRDPQDCQSGVCGRGLCRAPACNDGVKNGDESGIDCGGTTCVGCDTGGSCASGTDCASGVCVNGACQPGSCTDGVKNGAETAIDCGGGTCVVCTDGSACVNGSDCASNVCVAQVCLPAACGDGLRNGSETGVDCGGPDCSACDVGQGCTAGSDCTSGVCANGVCQAPSCTDGVRNGAETSTDCGGPTCVACGQGLFCNLNSDCLSGNCVAGQCGPVIITSILVTPGFTSVPAGRTYGFTAIATFSDGTTQDITNSAAWTSSDNTLARISATGLLEALSIGSTTVQATWAGRSGDATVQVTNATLDRLEVTPLNVSLPIGMLQGYRATGTFSDGSSGDLTTSVTWSSSTASVASIAADGVATALSAGSTSITATLGGISGSATLTVSTISVTSISVAPARATLPVGVRAAYVATALLSDGNARDITTAVTWSSSAPAIASVSPLFSGLVTAQSVGNATITATLGSITGSGALSVIGATLTGIQVFPANETVPRGFELHYAAVGLYSDGNAYDLTLTASWSSSVATVATVQNLFPNQGLVSTLDLGTTQIRATLGSLTGATALTVNGATLTSLSVTPASAVLPTGAPLQYAATGVFSDGLARDVTGLVQWQSSNVTVATISNFPGSHGLLMSVGAGNAIITATLGGLSSVGQLRVTNASFEGLSLSPPTARIGLQGVVPFVATAVYTDGTALDVTELSGWTSSNPTIASVRNDTGFRGVAVGLNSGNVTITASFNGHLGTAALSVSNANLSDLFISPAVVRTGIGIDVQFSVSGIWTDGTTADLTRVATWSSSANAVAVISNAIGSQGLATTLSAGVTTIGAAWAGSTDSTTLTVTNATLSSIALTPATTTTGIGVQVHYTALATFSDGTTFDITTVAAWSSSDPAVASVSGARGTVGVATALSGGTTTITAQLRTVSGTAVLTVSSAPLTGLLVTPATGIIPVGYWRQYTATAQYADGLTIDVTEQATWTTGTPAVAAAGNGALYGGRVTGLSPGNSSVIARFAGQGGTAAATVLAMKLTDLVLTPSNSSTPVGVPTQLTATGTFTAGNITIQLDITLQVGWKVAPKKNGTVSNTDGSRGVVTMYDASSAANILAHAWDPSSSGSMTANTKVFAP